MRPISLTECRKTWFDSNGLEDALVGKKSAIAKMGGRKLAKRACVSFQTAWATDANLHVAETKFYAILLVCLGEFRPVIAPVCWPEALFFGQSRLQ
jgi:hypothetical protein